MIRDLLLLLMNVFIGGWTISFAIYYFQHKQYFRFGLQVMWVISFVLFMIKIIFVA